MSGAGVDRVIASKAPDRVIATQAEHGLRNMRAFDPVVTFITKIRCPKEVGFGYPAAG